MKFFESRAVSNGNSAEDSIQCHVPTWLDISGPDDGYEGATLWLRVVLPNVGDANEIVGRILFPQRVRFRFAGSVDNLKNLVTRAPTAWAFLGIVREDDRFDAELG